jgi:hypothetical protein
MTSQRIFSNRLKVQLIHTDIGKWFIDFKKVRKNIAWHDLQVDLVAKWVWTVFELIENQDFTYTHESGRCLSIWGLVISVYLAGEGPSIPARPPITFTSDESLGTTILVLLARDCSTACNRRSNCAFPLKYRSAASLTNLIA